MKARLMAGKIAAMGIALSVGCLGAEITLRARVLSIKPEGSYVRLLYSTGTKWEELTREKPRLPTIEQSRPEPSHDRLSMEWGGIVIPEEESSDPAVLREEGPTYTTLWIRPGVWSPDAPVSDFPLFTTFMVVPRQQTGKHRRVQPGVLESVAVEFQIREGEQVLKTFSEKAGPSGRLTIRVASGRLDPNRPGLTGLSVFLEETMGILEYARRRMTHLASLPWADGPRPCLYGFLTACSGWNSGASDPEIWQAEYRTLRIMGVNGLMYDTWPGFDEEVCHGNEWMKGFRRLRGYNLNQILRWEGGGYLIPAFDPRNPERSRAEGWGCPFHPAHQSLPQKIQKAVADMVERLRQTPYEEYWGQTVDEIGSYFDRSAERKAHQGICPYCTEAFRDFLRGFGLSPDDFGVDSWEPIRSTYGYVKRAISSSANPSVSQRPVPVDLDLRASRDIPDDAEPTAEKAEPLVETVSAVPPSHPFPEWGWSLLTYYSRRFNNEASARIFTPLRDALNAQNARKRKALEEGPSDAPEAQQPWLYAGALRGNTFLMGGHSLDFFDWYRHADNAFMYETSNRDPRVWPWDSYLCDVGRIHQEKLGTRFTLMVKPSRGAVIQRALAALGRGVRMIYWYTYGPDWHHPDTFAREIGRLEKISRLAQMLGEAESRLYEAEWVAPAQVAVVRPFTSSVFEDNASWENGKWVYSILQHLHVPVDALDEGYLISEDLSRYRAIVISGSHLRRDCAVKLKEWVRAGGMLIASGCGLARDESDRPLDILGEVLGLSQRVPPTLWSEVRRYGATALAEYTPLAERPAGARVTLPGAEKEEAFDIVVGRELWTPSPEADILARYADGFPAVVRQSYGRGWAISFGYYAGLEYAADILRPDFDTSIHFNPSKRQILASQLQQAGVVPPLQIAHPMVEGLWLRHPYTREETIMLINWSYRGREEVPLPNVEIRWRSERPVSRVKSTWFQQRLNVEREGENHRLIIPRLEDGDILALE